MPFEFTPLTGLPEVILVEAKLFADQRGWFMETYKQADFDREGIQGPFVQDNHSCSTPGTLRGLHYQRHHPQGKLVRVVRGRIWDVAVDIRRGSPTFGRWVSAELSAENRRQLYVPPGFAHGFCVPGEETEVEYRCTDYYVPDDERGIIWSDTSLAIQWPISSPVLSSKDQNFPSLARADLPEFSPA